MKELKIVFSSVHQISCGDESAGLQIASFFSFCRQGHSVEFTLESNVISMSSLIISLATLKDEKGEKKKRKLLLLKIEHLMKFSQGIFSNPANDLQMLLMESFN